MKTRGRAVMVFSLALILAGCQSGTNGVDNRETFTVTVASSTGVPLEGAVIEGGIDWDAFHVETDAEGQATLPWRARNQEAAIHLNNHFPSRVTLRWPFSYSLTPTPMVLRSLGAIKGALACAVPGRLATVDYQGGYHLYAVDGSGLTEIATAEVARTFKQMRLIGDTLWLSTHDDGIYAYSLADLEHPAIALHVAVPGNALCFAVQDNILVVGNGADSSSVGIYVFAPDGSFVEAARFFDSYVSAVAFVNGYLVVTNYYDAHPKVFDLSDPASPFLVWDGADAAYWSGFLYVSQYIQIPKWDLETETATYGRLDLTDSILPQSAMAFQADSRLLAFVDDTTAVGLYYALGGAFSVLKGSLAERFETVALVSEAGLVNPFACDGCAPPYYIIGGQLWMLEDRATSGQPR